MLRRILLLILRWMLRWILLMGRLLMGCLLMGCLLMGCLLILGRRQVTPLRITLLLRVALRRTALVSAALPRSGQLLRFLAPRLRIAGTAVGPRVVLGWLLRRASLLRHTGTPRSLVTLALLPGIVLRGILFTRTPRVAVAVRIPFRLCTVIRVHRSTPQDE